MKSFARPVLLVVLLVAAVLVVPSSAQARTYAWGSWSDRSLQVKTRQDGYFSPGTKSAWQFQRNSRQTGKRQVRVIYRTWYLDNETYGPWVAGTWRGISPGQKLIVTGPLVFGCYYRDGHTGAEVVAQVRKKVHGTWAAPHELDSGLGSYALNC